jgi:hypothetical protein
MGKIRCSPLAVGVLLGALNGGPLGADDKQFDALWRQAEQNVKSAPGQQYFNDVFFKEFYGKYTVHVNECTLKTGERMMSTMKAAVELTATGGVSRVLVRPQSRPARCFADLVRKDSFSKPPSDRFWVPVEVRFTSTPP